MKKHLQIIELRATQNLRSVRGAELAKVAAPAPKQRELSEARATVGALENMTMIPRAAKFNFSTDTKSVEMV